MGPQSPLYVGANCHSTDFVRRKLCRGQDPSALGLTLEGHQGINPHQLLQQAHARPVQVMDFQVKTLELSNLSVGRT